MQHTLTFTVEDIQLLDELESHRESLEQLFDVKAGLEQLKDTLSNREVSQQEMVFANHSYRAYMQQLGVESSGFGLEHDSASFTTVSQEGIGKVLNTIWEAIKKAWAKIQDGVKKFFKWFADKGRAFFNKSTGILKKVRENKDMPVSPALESMIVDTAKWAKQYTDVLDKSYVEYQKANKESHALLRKVINDDGKDPAGLVDGFTKLKPMFDKTEKAIKDAKMAAPKAREDESDKKGKAVTLGEFEKELVTIEKLLEKTDKFVKNLESDFEEEDKVRKEFDKWTNSKKAEGAAFPQDVFRLGFQRHLADFQILTLGATKICHAIIGELHMLIKMQEVDLSKGMGDDKAVSDNLKKFIKSSDLVKVRTAVHMELRKKKASSKDLYAMMDWVEKQRPDIFEEYEEKKWAKAIDTDKKNWTVDYYDVQNVYLKANFAKKRISHIISVREFLHDKIWS
jgi:hypothetical protein